ncbi:MULTISPECIES: NACHT domain-containing protein [unclassified Paraflavitalea]|uniref:NACHT domain-containing protein n=1 Tax=unclassified Paraflavitalea TaxID=2798305 RepID=UPI003D3389F6
MTTPQKVAKLQTFKNEAEFRIFLIDLLKKMKYENVIHTHQYGKPEMGKDIICYLPHEIDGEDWYAFVVKHGRIGGGTSEIENIKNQIKQAFEYPYTNLKGDRVRINKVKVITNENFTNGAQQSISTSPELRSYSNIDFWYNENLIPIIDKYYSDFWLPGDEFCKEYTRTLKNKIQEEFELKDLSLNIEDKHIKKLLNLFIEPVLTELVIEDQKENSINTSPRVVKRKTNIQNISQCKENIIITGEPGSGKTKLVNNITLSLLNAQKNAEEKSIPIKLRGKDIKQHNFNIDHAVETSIKQIAPETSERTDLTIYRKTILVDEIDLLTKEEKIKLITSLSSYCKNNNKFILMQRRHENLDLELDDNFTKNIRINNFNIRQIEAFILKYFEGTDRGQKFIQVLKESNLFAKLPTTPLTVTLLSLLYDQNGYEIPATITDIYEDFVKVMIGKLEIRNRADLLLFNIKKRLFSNIALKMLDSKMHEITFEEFTNEINQFLNSKGYTTQDDAILKDLVYNSGMLYLDSNTNTVGFKQQAFIEYLASVEIYDHARNTHYDKLLYNFNDITWQNTAIFFAGKSKDLPDMITDLLQKMPNLDLRDWFVNAGGMGYLSQALYLTNNQERKKLVKKSLENMVKAFHESQILTQEENHFFSQMPLPLIATMLTTWFIENFKSITLRLPLNEAFEEIATEYSNADINDFDGDFKLFLLASTLLHKNIDDDTAFNSLIERNSFIKNPVLMVAGDLFLETGDIHRKNQTSEISKKIRKQVKHHLDAIKNVIKLPAYRIDKDYKLLDKPKDNIL